LLQCTCIGKGPILEETIWTEALIKSTAFVKDQKKRNSKDLSNAYVQRLLFLYVCNMLFKQGIDKVHYQTHINRIFSIITKEGVSLLSYDHPYLLEEFSISKDNLKNFIKTMERCFSPLYVTYDRIQNTSSTVDPQSSTDISMKNDALNSSQVQNTTFFSSKKSTSGKCSENFQELIDFVEGLPTFKSIS
jgi:hypothetical protein